MLQTGREQMKKVGKKIISVFEQFFCSKGKFSPVYFWATIFIAIIVADAVMKMTACCHARISDQLLLGMMGFVMTFLGLYNWTKNGKENENSQSNISVPGPGIIDTVRSSVDGILPGKKGNATATKNQAPPRGTK